MQHWLLQLWSFWNYKLTVLCFSPTIDLFCSTHCFGLQSSALLIGDIYLGCLQPASGKTVCWMVLVSYYHPGSKKIWYFRHNVLPETDTNKLLLCWGHFYHGNIMCFIGKNHIRSSQHVQTDVTVWKESVSLSRLHWHPITIQVLTYIISF